jgi:hypothetical protein
VSNTSQQVTLIKYRAPKYSREEILSVLSEVYGMVYNQNVKFTEYLDPTTGMPPFLATTAGTYSYNCPTNCREVEAVFSKSTQYYNGYYPDQNDPDFINYMNQEWFLAQYKPYPATTDTVAKVMFNNLFDPGTTTDQYYLLYWLKAETLDSESVEMQMPQEMMLLMRKAVLCMLGVEDYGDGMNEYALIERIKRDFRNMYNNKAQSQHVGHVLPQPEYRVYSGSQFGRRPFWGVS